MALSLGSHSLWASEVRFEVPLGGRDKASLVAEGGLELSGFELAIEGAAQRYRFSSASAKPLRVSGLAPIAAEHLQLGAGSVAIESGVVEIAIDGVEARDLAIDLPGVSLRAARVAALALSFEAGAVVVHGLSVEGLALEWSAPTDTDTDTDADTQAPAAPRASTPEKPAIDWSFLDHLEGRVHADVEVEYRAPVVGQRRATHRIDVPIASGQIDYRRLESGLAHLENSVLDFELEESALILEKDLPLVPFDNQTLVRWPLSVEEHSRAENGQVRLARLFAPELPASDRPAGKGADRKSFQLDDVSVENLDVALSLVGGTAVDCLGGSVELIGDRPVDGLAIAGRAGQRGESELTIALAGLESQAAGLKIGSNRIRDCQVQLSGLGGSLAMIGFRVSGVKASIDTLAVPHLSFAPE